MISSSVSCNAQSCAGAAFHVVVIIDHIVSAVRMIQRVVKCISAERIVKCAEVRIILDRMERRRAFRLFCFFCSLEPACGQ